jgi:hypothetical protein
MNRVFVTMLAVFVSSALFFPLAEARTTVARASRHDFHAVHVPRRFCVTEAPRQNFLDVRAPRVSR